MKICENCGNPHDGSYGKGRFCCKKCAGSYSGKLCKGVPKPNKSKSMTGEGNPMFGRTFYDIWVEEFGVEEADRRYEEWKILQYEKSHKGEDCYLYGTNMYEYCLKTFGKEEADRIKEQMERNHLENAPRGKNHPNYRKSPYEQLIERHGLEEGKHRYNAMRQKRSENNSGDGNPMAGKFGEDNPNTGKIRSKETRDLIAKIRRDEYANGTRERPKYSKSITGFYYVKDKPPMFFGSTSELIFIREYSGVLVRLDRGEYITPIPYTKENTDKTSTYGPDLGDLEKKIIFEIKGMKPITKNELLKIKAGIKWCRENGWIYRVKRMPKIRLENLFPMILDGIIEFCQKRHVEKYEQWFKKRNKSV